MFASPKRGCNPSFLVYPLKNHDTPVFSSDYTWSIEYLRCNKRVSSERGLTYPLSLILTHLLGILPLKTKLPDSPLIPFSGKLLPPRRPVRTMWCFHRYPQLVHPRWTKVTLHISMFHFSKRSLLHKVCSIPSSDRNGEKNFYFYSHLWTVYTCLQFYTLFILICNVS